MFRVDSVFVKEWGWSVPKTIAQTRTFRTVASGCYEANLGYSNFEYFDRKPIFGLWGVLRYDLGAFLPLQMKFGLAAHGVGICNYGRIITAWHYLRPNNVEQRYGAIYLQLPEFVRRYLQAPLTEINGWLNRQARTKRVEQSIRFRNLSPIQNSQANPDHDRHNPYSSV